MAQAPRLAVAPGVVAGENRAMDALAALALQIEWGADEALAEAPIDRRTLPPAPAAPALAMPPAMAAPPPAPTSTPAVQAGALAAAAADLAALHAALAAFDGCALRTTATSLVFSSGDPAAGVMLVADVPGAAEDRAGTPFAGAAAAFLDRMLASIGLDLGRVYAGSLLPWRPPGDRRPSEGEIQACLPFFWRHVALAHPRHLVVMGAVAARTLLPGTARRPRSGWHALAVPGLADAVPTLALASPAAIQHAPAAKQEAWAQWVRLRRALDKAAGNAAITDS